MTVQPVPDVPTGVMPDYWRCACRHLARHDRILRRLIPRYGDAALESRGDPFVTLARSIVGQQISVKAAQAVWDRFAAAAGSVTPTAVLRLTEQAMRGAGLSQRKTSYLQDLARHFESGRIRVQEWAHLPDETIIKELVTIRGIGRWTAEMFLIFHLLRPDVLPLDDVGLVKAVSINYFSGEAVTRSEIREVAEGWAPWRSVATWYMWRSLDPLPVAY